MQVNLAHRPRLSSLQPIAPAEAAEAAAEAPRKGPQRTDARTLAERNGYNEGFLPGWKVKWPSAGDNQGDVLPVPGTRDNLLTYTNFSVMMSASRRIAMCVGVNISGKDSVQIPRDKDAWYFDGRIPDEAQIGEDLYAGNLLDRGHLVRREDPNWGADAQTANEDTFHFTNCSPQMGAFNQKTWLSLENYVLKNARNSEERITVFSGPVFGTRDLEYRDVLIPLAFWKVIAFIDDEGNPSATAYLISQKGELSALEVAFGAFKTYQRSVAYVEEITGLDFHGLADYDGFSNEERATGTRIEAELASAGAMRV
ncbi:DNA/RNA non-specific endonuclease [Polaromonas naphthalenivorans]|uniref:DNA/RNA non-specific endonuclease n=1 Tax=Polaromonas naphthalenivorans (strain CJ2) TaxID=365044 RepID=A1VVN5_POLNA|nr:DNA/RNA non-specific endonuclease [Polaromonas naphthalenivorans]ABM39713.1 DNA/RNA non-specific endonuclease [Polaromonas naphthalenivorans CJ2]